LETLVAGVVTSLVEVKIAQWSWAWVEREPNIVGGSIWLQGQAAASKRGNQVSVGAAQAKVLREREETSFVEAKKLKANRHSQMWELKSSPRIKWLGVGLVIHVATWAATFGPIVSPVWGDSTSGQLLLQHVSPAGKRQCGEREGGNGERDKSRQRLQRSTGLIGTKTKEKLGFFCGGGCLFLLVAVVVFLFCFWDRVSLV
jgi:hypothetical protein